MKTALTLAVAALTAVAGAAPASAGHTVTVSLALSAGAYAPTGAACRLQVPPGANGLAVLDAAVAQRCIVSYDTVSYPGFGTFVTCLDEVCGVAAGPAGSYWNMYENGASTGYGVDGFTADAGDELGFAYQAYCFAVVCPPL